MAVIQKCKLIHSKRITERGYVQGFCRLLLATSTATTVLSILWLRALALGTFGRGMIHIVTSGVCFLTQFADSGNAAKILPQLCSSSSLKGFTKPTCKGRGRGRVRASLRLPPNNSRHRNGRPSIVVACTASNRIPTQETIEDKLRRAADWKEAESYKENGQIFEGKVEGSNSGGLLVQFNSLQGFLPFSQISTGHLLEDGSNTMAEIAKKLIGCTLLLKIIDASEEEKKLIFSEKTALLSKFADQTKLGDVFKGKVTAVTNFGAFIDVPSPDGSFQVNGMVHVSEISWDLVQDARDVLKKGLEVQVKVIQIDLERTRLSLSIKQLQSDPLFETLESVMHQEDVLTRNATDGTGEVPNEPLPGLEEICQELLLEEGISSVRIGRQALEKRVVSQDLEIWLSNASVENGKFTLLARAGRQVQEVHLDTTLNREAIKLAVKRVTGRVP